jgi:hypothetical protein
VFAAAHRVDQRAWVENERAATHQHGRDLELRAVGEEHQPRQADGRDAGGYQHHENIHRVVQHHALELAASKTHPVDAQSAPPKHETTLFHRRGKREGTGEGTREACCIGSKFEPFRNAEFRGSL